MVKPHIKHNGHCWQCRTDGITGVGHSPREAYAQWAWAWHCRAASAHAWANEA